MSPNRHEVDLLNEVLNIDFDWGAAKISEIKAGNQKKNICWLTPSSSAQFFAGWWFSVMVVTTT